MSIGDGAIITNAEGCVELLNPVVRSIDRLDAR